MGRFGLWALVCQLLVLIDLRKWAKSVNILVLYVNDHMTASIHKRTTRQPNRQKNSGSWWRPGSVAGTIGSDGIVLIAELEALNGPLWYSSFYCYAMPSLLTAEANAGSPVQCHSSKRPASHLAPSWSLSPSGKTVDFILNYILDIVFLFHSLCLGHILCEDSQSNLPAGNSASHHLWPRNPTYSKGGMAMATWQ